MRLRLPWSKRDNEDTEGDDALRRSYDDDYDEQDELDDEEEVSASDAEEDETPEALAGLDDEQRAAVEAYLEQERQASVAAHTAAWREAFQSSGFDLTPDGKPLVADPAKVMETFSAFRQPPPTTPAETASAAPEPEDDDTVPDPITNPREFRRWLNAEKDKAARDAVAQLQPRIEQQEQWRWSQEERGAMERVRSILPGSAVSQLGAPEHQETFQRAFLEAYRQVPPENRGHLSDDDLEQLAAFTIPKVFPRGQQKRDDQGRYTSERSRNAALYQQSHQQSPDGTRAPRNPPLDEQEARVAKQYGMTPEEYRAYSTPGMTVDDHRAMKAKAKGKR